MRRSLAKFSESEASNHAVLGGLHHHYARAKFSVHTAETDEVSIGALGDAALGMVTASHYSAAHDSELNKAFVRDFEASTGGRQRVSFAAVAAYDAMAAIYTLAEAQGGRLE